MMEHTHSPNHKHYDVIVIGGGPSGALTAGTLAQKGHSVLVLEKELFPRFHIGESLLPYNAGMLDKIGLFEELENGDFVLKRGAEFTGVSGNFHRVNFTAQGPGRKEYTFQVERAQFDRLLLDYAINRGAEVYEGAQVTDLLHDEERIIGVTYKKDGNLVEVHANFVVDASGRIGKIANHFKLRKMNKRLNMVAVYKHFNNLDERNNPGTQGDIQIGNHEEGWVWAIPIHDDVISVGAVMPKEIFQKDAPDEIFERHYKMAPRIAQRLAGATPMTEVTVESDFCYHSERIAGSGYFLVGDSACFVDPIFSAGVYLGMVTGWKAAEAIDQILQDGVLEEEAQAAYENFYKTGYDCYYRLIYAFYESNFNFGAYVKSIPFPVEGKWISRLLSGDFWSKHNPLTQYLRSVSRWDTFEEPFDVVYGCPVYPELDAQEQSMMEAMTEK